MTKQNTDRTGYRGLIQLFICILVISLIWTTLLPIMGEIDSVKAWIEPLRTRGINPAGMYYTDVYER